ncbi:MAG: hypothetical protein PHD76_04030 [Methylacidiphilales bacterium]|nr:hypothetical protein [Candidatus Methylacidiphilales bacterium]
MKAKSTTLSLFLWVAMALCRADTIPIGPDGIFSLDSQMFAGAGSEAEYAPIIKEKLEYLGYLNDKYSAFWTQEIKVARSQLKSFTSDEKVRAANLKVISNLQQLIIDDQAKLDALPKDYETARIKVNALAEERRQLLRDFEAKKKREEEVQKQEQSKPVSSTLQNTTGRTEQKPAAPSRPAFNGKFSPELVRMAQQALALAQTFEDSNNALKAFDAQHVGHRYPPDEYKQLVATQNELRMAARQNLDAYKKFIADSTPAWGQFLNETGTRVPEGVNDIDLFRAIASGVVPEKWAPSKQDANLSKLEAEVLDKNVNTTLGPNARATEYKLKITATVAGLPGGFGKAAIALSVHDADKSQFSTDQNAIGGGAIDIAADGSASGEITVHSKGPGSISIHATAVISGQACQADTVVNLP